MKARFDAGTDAAMVGAWDAARNTQPFTSAEFKRLSSTLDADAADGHIFLIHTNADGGGAIDAYIDEAIPSDVAERLELLAGEFLLALPSGALIVDGAEYYRARKPDPKMADRVVTVPPGDYAVRCYVANDDEEATPKSELELLNVVGSEDLAYYDRMNKTGCLVGGSTLLLFPLLSFPLGWKWALGITLVVFLAFFHARQWILERNARYTRLTTVVSAFRLEQQDPSFVLEFRSIRDRAGLKGGSVTLS